jgi:hypothetical protein
LFFEWLYPLIAETAPQDRTLTLLRQWENSPERYRQQFFLPVGEQLWTLTFALASGYVAYFAYATRREK